LEHVCRWENNIKMGVNGAVDWIHVAHDGFIVVEGCFADAELLPVCLCTCRYIAVTQPIKYAKHKNNRRVWLTIVLVWVISAAIGSPIVLGLNNTPDRRHDHCLFYNSDFIIYSSLSSFYIPCIIMVFLYYNIFKVSALPHMCACPSACMEETENRRRGLHEAWRSEVQPNLIIHRQVPQKCQHSQENTKHPLSLLLTCNSVGTRHNRKRSFKFLRLVLSDFFFYVLLAAHLSIFILVINQLNAQNFVLQ